MLLLDGFGNLLFACCWPVPKAHTSRFILLNNGSVDCGRKLNFSRREMIPPIPWWCGSAGILAGVPPDRVGLPFEALANEGDRRPPNSICSAQACCKCTTPLRLLLQAARGRSPCHSGVNKRRFLMSTAQ